MKRSRPITNDMTLTLPALIEKTINSIVAKSDGVHDAVDVLRYV